MSDGTEGGVEAALGELDEILQVDEREGEGGRGAWPFSR
jgi:hypothetical protein